MKKIFFVFILSIAISSCKNNKVEKPECFMKRYAEFPQTDSKEGTVEFYYNLYFANCQHSLEEFLNRVKECSKEDPKNDYFPPFYAMSNYSLSKFKKRFNESETPLKEFEIGGMGQLFYAKSENTLTQFIEKIKEFPKEKLTSTILHYASSIYTYSEFMNRVKDFQSSIDDETGYLNEFYASSKNLLCDKKESSSKETLNEKLTFDGVWVADPNSHVRYDGNRITDITITKNGANYLFVFNKNDLRLKTMGTVDQSNNISLYGGEWLLALDATNKDNLFLKGELFHRVK